MVLHLLPKAGQPPGQWPMHLSEISTELFEGQAGFPVKNYDKLEHSMGRRILSRRQGEKERRTLPPLRPASRPSPSSRSAEMCTCGGVSGWWNLSALAVRFCKTRCNCPASAGT